MTNVGAHSGTQAIKITKGYAGSTWVSVNRGQSYTLKAWYKWSQFNGSQSGTDGLKVYNYDWSEVAKAVELHTLYSQNTWSEVAISFTPTTDNVYIEFGLFGAQDAVEIYFDDLSLITLSSTPTISTGPRWKFYYYSGSERIAMRVRDSSSNNLYYLINDQISSTSKVVDENGNIFSETRYYPFGGTRFVSPNDAPTDLRYTGQRQDSYINLYWMGSRWYDQTLGRFIQPDTIIPIETQGVQAWDRFGYVNNNPINAIDPTGHMQTECNDGGCSATIGQIAYDEKRYYEQNCQSGYGGGCPDYAGAIVFGVTGLVAVGVGGAIVEGLGNAAIAGITGAGSTALETACADGDCTNEIELSAKLGQNVWNMSPFARGWEIEGALGRSPQLVSNFPTIDRWENGLATSIKSIDLTARSYQNLQTLQGTLEGYVTKLVNFTGASYGGTTIDLADISGRQLLLAIPPNATAEQIKVIQQVVSWAATQGVTVTTQVIR